MIKKVPIEELQPGTHIKRFDCGWLDHPFLFNRKRIKSREDLERLKTWGVTHAYIEIEPGPDPAPVESTPEKFPPPVEFKHIITPQTARVDRELKHIPVHHEKIGRASCRERV